MTHDTNNGDGDGTRGIGTENTRRRFMAGSAGALGGLALGGAFATGAFADEHDAEDQDAPPQGNATEGEFEDDIDVLNYALTLEHLEAEFYEQAFDNLGSNDIQESETLEPFGEKIHGRVVGDLAKIRDHEVRHVEVLEETIEALGGDPIEKPEFDFGGATEDADAFLATARVLENTGVAAYAGAAPSIENADLVPPALSIHSVEARHASFLNLLTGGPGFPEAFDDPSSRADVEAAVADFIVDEGDDGDASQDEDADHDENGDHDEDTDYDENEDYDEDADDDEAGDQHGSKDKDDDEENDH